MRQQGPGHLGANRQLGGAGGWLQLQSDESCKENVYPVTSGHSVFAERSKGQPLSRTSDPVYRRRRAALKRAPDGDVCHACNQWIDMDLKWPHPDSWTADHITPVGKGGHNRGLVLPAHWRCNLARRYEKPKPVTHARRW